MTRESTRIVGKLAGISFLLTLFGWMGVAQWFLEKTPFGQNLTESTGYYLGIGVFVFVVPSVFVGAVSTILVVCPTPNTLIAAGVFSIPIAVAVIAVFGLRVPAVVDAEWILAALTLLGAMGSIILPFVSLRSSLLR